MDNTTEHLNDLHEIKQMMERSSRFISLSGWSGIAAGICALIGAYFANKIIVHSPGTGSDFGGSSSPYADSDSLSTRGFISHPLFTIAVFTFIGALVSAVIFTYARSRQNHTPIWSTTSRRLTLNVCIPLFAGGIYLLKLIENGTFGLIAPGCLIFYGLALVNGSKYTLGEVKYLGYAEVILGIISCWFLEWGLYFWAVGFGVMHVVYGTVMWYRYERNG